MSSGTNKQRILQNNTAIGTNNSAIDDIKTTINNLPSTGSTTAEASDILLNKTAVSKGRTITGTLGTESKNVKSTTTQQTITPTTGKLINEIIVEPMDLETKNVTPSLTAQTILPTSGKDGISQINVGGASSHLMSISDTITSNGTYYFNSGIEGIWGFTNVEVIVDVPTSTGGGSETPSNRVRYYTDAQSRQQAINQEYLNIGDIGLLLENAQETTITDNSNQNYLSFKFEEQFDVNSVQGDPYSVNISGGAFEPYNNYNEQMAEVIITDYNDVLYNNQPAVFELHFTYNSNNYTLKAEYTYDNQAGYLNRQSANIYDGNDEIVSSIDASGYIFLPYKFHTATDFWQLSSSWFIDSGIVKGMYANSMREPLMFDGQNWTTTIYM